MGCFKITWRPTYRLLQYYSLVYNLILIQTRVSYIFVTENSVLYWLKIYLQASITVTGSYSNHFLFPAFDKIKEKKCAVMLLDPWLPSYQNGACLVSSVDAMFCA